MELGDISHEDDLDIKDFDDDDLLEEDGDELEEEEEDAEEAVPNEEAKVPALASYRTKIVQILKNLHSPEIKIYSDASKEFIGLLRGESGGAILCEYIQLAPKCSELAEAWRLHQGKPGMFHILSLVSVILDHPEGKGRSGGVCKNLENFAHLIVETKLDDIYAELNSHESRRQSAALNLLASIIRRGAGLASDVAKVFDFKLPVLSKLSGLPKKGPSRRDGRHGVKPSMRRAFVGFAMSFVEVGSPRLLRWILQQREMYSGVLRAIGSDEIDIIISVLSTLRDKVLSESSLITPGLRSVLFGSATLEQLSYISGSPVNHGASLAHEVLVMVCTDPKNGLMPCRNLKGNEKRLFELMKKLKATEVGYHKELLLAIVSKSPTFSAAYMDEFPYHLEPRSSTSWFTAISLAADVISAVKFDTWIMNIAHTSNGLLAVNNDDLCSIFRSIIPRACTRSVVNKGLLHADIIVKHSTLRLIWESLKAVDSLIVAVDSVANNGGSIGNVCISTEKLTNLCSFSRLNKFFDVEASGHNDHVVPGNWVLFKQCIQDEVRTILPDPQVLLKLLSSLSYKASLKRADRPDAISEVAVKRLKSDRNSEKLDMVISGIDTEHIIVDPKHKNGVGVEGSNSQELVENKNQQTLLSEMWDLNKQIMGVNEPIDAQSFFYTKLLDVLKLYMRITPSSFEGCFDFFRVLPTNPLTLPTNQQQSLLSLLLEYIGESPGNRLPQRVPEFMYKNLQPITTLLMYSQHEEIKAQAYTLAHASLLSTGAFDKNLSEIDAWLCSLPGYKREFHAKGSQGAEAFRNLYGVVISFLCDAVSTVGNNLYKHLDHVHKLMSDSENSKDDPPDFSPLVICTLQKCLRLLESDSGTFKLYERSLISLYVCDALSLILQSQVDMKGLPRLIYSVLNEKFIQESKDSFCEWRPLRNLLKFAQNLIDKQRWCLSPIIEISPKGCNSFILICSKIDEYLRVAHSERRNEVVIALLSSIICASPVDMLQNLHLLLTVAQLHFNSYVPFLSYLFFLEPTFLAEVAKLYPDIFLLCLEKVKEITWNNHGAKNNFSLQGNSCCKSAGVSFSSDNLISKESAAAILSLLLRDASSYSLFATLMCFGSYGNDLIGMSDVLHSCNMVHFLKLKLAQSSAHELVLFLQFVLFWAYQILSSYKTEPSDALEKHFQMCCTLLDFLFEQLVVVPCGYSDSTITYRSSNIEDVLELIFHHPVVNLVMSEPLDCSRYFANEKLVGGGHVLLVELEQNLHPMDRLLLHFLIRILKESCLENRSSFGSSRRDSVKRVFTYLFQKATCILRKEFNVCVERRDFTPFLPYFYTFCTLMPFASPFDLLELVHEMFSELQIDRSASNSKVLSFVPFCLSIVDSAFDILLRHLKHYNLKSEFNSLSGVNDEQFSDVILEDIYTILLDLATRLEIESAYQCLLKVANVVYNQRFGKMSITSLPFCTLLSRLVINSPKNLLLNCLHPTNKVKSKLLFLILQVSPVHMRIFSQTLLSYLNKSYFAPDGSYVDAARAAKEMVVNSNDLSEDDFLLLLPASLSCFMFNLQRCPNKDLNSFGRIPNFYSTILMKGFSNWKSFVSGSLFQNEYHELVTNSSNDLHNLFSNSILANTVRMLYHYFGSHGNSVTMKQRLLIFNSIYDHSCEILDGDIKHLNSCVYQEALKIVNEVHAKISLTRLLLSLDENSIQFVIPKMEGELHDMISVKQSKRLNHAKIRFITILVNTLDLIVQMFPRKSVIPSQSSSINDILHLSKFLEHSILKNITELLKEIRNFLDQLSAVPFLSSLIRSSLLNRFEDPITLKAIRCLLAALPEGKFSSSELLDLLLGHSQFVPSLLCSVNADPSALISNETILQPIPSVFKSLDVYHDDREAHGFNGLLNVSQEEAAKHSTLEERRLELIRLLRVVYHHKKRDNKVGSEGASDNSSRELVFLLLSAYDATLNETDVELLHLIHEIETIEGSEYDIISEVDYLWGTSILKIRKELSLDHASPSTPSFISDLPEDQHKNLFREGILVDSQKCVTTILQFCYDRSSIVASFSLEKLLEDNFTEVLEKSSYGETVKGYDPVFMMRFSLHSLLMGFIGAVEFARVGLLAFTFVCISSPDQELRKLGYEVLGRFKLALENCQRSKESLQLQLLLSYFQNGISEPWEQVPSVVAIFAAEASFILLDPSQNHFFTISKLLLRASKVNLKSIPLFHTFFRSSSVHFKAERLWILHLLYAGINTNDDAKIFRSNKILEFLLSYYASSMSDAQSKNLILWIVKKSVELPILANHLVKECGLLPWLSSVLSFSCKKVGAGGNESSLKIMKLVLRVVNDVVSSRSISEWLQDCALEQLSQLSSYLHILLIDALKYLKEDISLVNSILHVMISTISLSLKRKICQPHFTISLHGLSRLYQSLNTEFNNIRHSLTNELALTTILMTAPVPFESSMDRARLLDLIIWAIPSALNICSKLRPLDKECSSDIYSYEEEEQEQEEKGSLISKLLRWITASVILGSISKLRNVLRKRSYESLLSLLESIADEGYNNLNADLGVKKLLCGMILYLQQLVKEKFICFPSVTAALYLLLPPGEGYRDNGHVQIACSRLCCPVEVNPAWRWSFHQPWRDPTREQTEAEQLQEEQTCRSLLLELSNAFSRKMPSVTFLSLDDLSDLFQWERENLFESNVEEEGRQCSEV